jgi:hypothetical protein
MSLDYFWNSKISWNLPLVIQRNPPAKAEVLLANPNNPRILGWGWGSLNIIFNSVALFLRMKFSKTLKPYSV